MKSNFSALVTKLGMIGVLVSFFVPWAEVHVDFVRSVRFLTERVEKTMGTDLLSKAVDRLNLTAYGVTGAQKTLLLSGFDMARLEKSPAAELLGSMMTLTGQASRDPRQVKYLYGIPLGGLLAGSLLLLTRRSAPSLTYWVSLGIMALTLVAAIKVGMTALDQSFAKVKLLPGLWTTFACFFVMGLSSFIGSGRLKKRRRS